jgi:hypothetical protein
MPRLVPAVRACVRWLAALLPAASKTTIHHVEWVDEQRLVGGGKYTYIFKECRMMSGCVLLLEVMQHI